MYFVAEALDGADQRAVLVPIGASLVARDNLVGTVKGLTTKYSSRASLEREIKRYERRGATERNRFERQVRRTRAAFERELRQRRSNVEKTVGRTAVGSSARSSPCARTSRSSRTSSPSGSTS